MNIIFGILVSISSILSPYINRDTEISNVHVYKNFMQSGRTKEIMNAFNSSDVSKINRADNDKYSVNKTDLEEAFANTVSIQDYHRQNVSGIFFAGEFTRDNVKHFFAYLNDGKLIIDFTDKKEYFLKSELHFLK